MAIPQMQIVPISNRQLADFSPARPDVRELVERIKAGLKIKDASDQEYVALATMALAHNLDPFNGECWIIPGKGVMAGIKGLRKAADSQLPSTAFRNPQLRLLQHSEYNDYAIPDSCEIAAICELTRSDATQNWLGQLKDMTALGMPYEEALTHLGKRPVWIGIGIVKKTDQSKMDRIQLAFKRAESDAMKKAFNLPFNIDLARENGDMYPVDGEYTDESAATATETGEQPEGETQQTLTRPYDADTVRRAIQLRVSKSVGADKNASDKQQQYVASLLTKAFSDSATADKDRHAVQQWITGKASVKLFSAAGAKAFIDWLADETGDLGQDGYHEAQNVLRAAMLEQGQGELPGMDEA